MIEVEVTQINLSKQEMLKKTDLIAEDEPVHIFVNKNLFSTILCTPRSRRELVVGHLLSEGVILSLDEVVALKVHERCFNVSVDEDLAERRLRKYRSYSRIVTSSCGSPTLNALSGVEGTLEVRSNLMVDAEIVSGAAKKLNSAAETYRKTGGVHAAALCTADGNFIVFREDVGRHNAVDKVVGAAAYKNTRFDRCFLAISGRVTGDIVLKAARMNIPIIASQAAAISSGVEVANHAKVTVAGFARGKRLNIYTYPERIRFTT